MVEAAFVTHFPIPPICLGYLIIRFMGQIDDGGKSMNHFLSPFKNTHSAISFDCMIRKVFSDHAIKWKSAVPHF